MALGDIASLFPDYYKNSVVGISVDIGTTTNYISNVTVDGITVPIIRTYNDVGLYAQALVRAPNAPGSHLIAAEIRHKSDNVFVANTGNLNVNIIENSKKFYLRTQHDYSDAVHEASATLDSKGGYTKPRVNLGTVPAGTIVYTTAYGYTEGNVAWTEKGIGRSSIVYSSSTPYDRVAGVVLCCPLIPLYGIKKIAAQKWKIAIGAKLNYPGEGGGVDLLLAVWRPAPRPNVAGSGSLIAKICDTGASHNHIIAPGSTIPTWFEATINGDAVNGIQDGDLLVAQVVGCAHRATPTIATNRAIYLYHDGAIEYTPGADVTAGNVAAYIESENDIFEAGRNNGARWGYIRGSLTLSGGAGGYYSNPVGIKKGLDDK